MIFFKEKDFILGNRGDFLKLNFLKLKFEKQFNLLQIKLNSDKVILKKFLKQNFKIFNFNLQNLKENVFPYQNFIFKNKFIIEIISVKEIYFSYLIFFPKITLKYNNLNFIEMIYLKNYIIFIDSLNLFIKNLFFLKKIYKIMKNTIIIKNCLEKKSILEIKIFIRKSIFKLEEKTREELIQKKEFLKSYNFN